MEVLFLTVGLAIGIMIGVGIIFAYQKKNTTGNLRVTYSDESESPYLFLEVLSTIEELSKNKYVTFKVNIENYSSRD